MNEADVSEERPVPILRRHVFATLVGNALEFYDFTTYTYFAAQIGHTFFPSHSHFVSLMASLGVFGVGFLGRPIGAVVIGAYGDRVGRKPAMLVSFALMGAAILGLVFVPSYAAIGIVAPILVVGLRLIQGFALGGDVGPTTAFLLEAAPPERRGFYASLQYASQGLSTLLGGLVGVALSSVLTAPQLESFGWRIAFLFGAIILPIGLVIRRSLPETLHDERADEAAAESWRGHIPTIAVGFAMLGSATIGFYVLAYMTTYASQFLHMRTNVSFAATAIFGIANIIFSPLSGTLSDRIGRRPVMIGSRIVFALATIPAFMLVVRYRETSVLLAATFVLGALSQMGAPSIVGLTEALPRSIRSASLSVTYATAIAIFGGTTQPAVTWLLHQTGDLLSPAYYLMIGNIAGVLAMLAMAETAPVVLERRRAAVLLRQSA
jgi:MFS family permease